MKASIKTFIVTPLLLAAAACFGQEKDLVTGLVNIESVAKDGKFLYATSIGKELNPMAKDGDGAVYKLSLDGKVLEENISKETLNAPKGTAIIKNVLYVADVDRVVGLDLSTGTKVAEIDFSPYKTSFLNDIAVKDDSTIFVSATDISKVFEVKLRHIAQIQALPVEPQGPNGLFYDKKSNKLYVAGLVRGDVPKGVISCIAFSKNQSPQYTKVADVNGFFDGIQLINSKTLIVSDWVVLRKKEGVLNRIDLKSGRVEKISTSEKFGGAADILFDKESKSLLIPVLMEGKLVKIQL